MPFLGRGEGEERGVGTGERVEGEEGERARILRGEIGREHMRRASSNNWLRFMPATGGMRVDILAKAIILFSPPTSARSAVRGELLDVSNLCNFTQ